jgi:hypothetical protein
MDSFLFIGRRERPSLGRPVFSFFGRVLLNQGDEFTPYAVVSRYSWSFQSRAPTLYVAHIFRKEIDAPDCHDILAVRMSRMMNFYCSEKHDKQISSILIGGQYKTK